MNLSLQTYTPTPHPRISSSGVSKHAAFGLRVNGRATVLLLTPELVLERRMTPQGFGRGLDVVLHG